MCAPESPVCSFLAHPSLIEFPSHIAAVFFVDGCNFRCRFCHNPALITRQQEHLSWAQLKRVCAEFLANWVDSAVLTGGEPTMSPELGRLVSFLKEPGWAVKLDTNGSNPKALELVIDRLDYVAMDVKAGPSWMKELTGFDRPERILESVKLVQNRARDYEFRTTIIPSVHTNEHMCEIGRIIEGARRYVIQPFVPRAGLPDQRLEAESRPSPERLAQIRNLMAKYADEVLVRGS